MNNHNFNCSITVPTTAKQAFSSINKVYAWWTENFNGQAEKEGDMFTVRFGETFADFKIIEAEYNKIVWLVTDSWLQWLEDKNEWTGTTVVWQLTEKDSSTIIDFTHSGLTPEKECFEDCRKGWTGYVQGSLFKLITEGKGAPDKKIEVVV